MSLHSNSNQDKEFPLSKFCSWLYVFVQVFIFLLDSDSHQENKKWEPTPLQTEVTFQTIAPPSIIMPLDTTDIYNQVRNLREAIENIRGIKILSEE